MNKKVLKISRRARLLAQQNHIDPASVTPTGPDGRIIERDILRELEKNDWKTSSEIPVAVSDIPVAEENLEEELCETEETVAFSEEEANEELSVADTAAEKEPEELSVEETAAEKEPEALSVADIADEKDSEAEQTETERTAIVAAPVSAVVKDGDEKEKRFEGRDEAKKAYTLGAEDLPHTDVMIPRTEAAPNAAPFTVTMSFDADGIMRLYRMIQEKGEEKGLTHIKLGDMILFATAKLLKKHKALNAHFLGDKLRCFNGVHIGFSVDTDHGIETAAVIDADRLSLSGLAKITESLILSAEAGRIDSERNKSLASFAVSDFSAMGVEAFTPILKGAQTGALGVCAPQKRIKERDGKDVSYFCIPLSLTFDSRALGMASATAFLRELCGSLENFELLLIQ